MKAKLQQSLVLSKLYTELMMVIPYETFTKKQKTEISIPPSAELAKQLALTTQYTWTIYDDLLQKKIFSKRGVGRGVRFFLKNPQLFRIELKNCLLLLHKKPIMFAFPPTIRQKKRKEQIHVISDELSESSDEVALIFSSPFIVSNSPRYQSARIMQYQAAPIYLSGSSKAIEILEIQIGLKQIQMENILIGKGLTYPKDPSFADIIYYENEALLGKYFYEPDSNPIKSISAPLNQLLLEEFPVRGIEAAERLAEVLGDVGGQ